MARKIDRENLMKMIYQMSMQDDFSEEACKAYKMNVLEREPEDGYFMRGFHVLAENLAEIDAEIEKYSRRWKTARMPKVDLAILRVAAAEILYMEDIPPIVSADEAVEMAKKFSTEKSFRFINGVLASIVKEKENAGRNGASDEDA